MKRDENGHIVVETVGTFIPLVLLIISILSLVNLVAVQARIHYAMTQTAMSMSVYGYLLEVTEIKDGVINFNNSTKVPKSSNEIFNDLNSALSGISNIVGNDNNKKAGEMVNSIRDIKDILEGGAGGIISGALIKPVFMQYLENGEMNGEEFLRRFNINDLHFFSSSLLDDDENVKITAHYKVDYTFGALPLPFGPSLRVTQTAITKAWMNGSGEGYRF
jgi:hypothetical protein